MFKRTSLALFLTKSPLRSFTATRYKLLEPINENEHMSYGLPELMNLYVHNHKVNNTVSLMEKQLSGSKFDKTKYEKHTKGLYNHIKKKITNTGEKSLEKVANHYFQKEGKLIRPLINFCLAELIYALQGNKKPFKKSVSYENQKDWASLVEILHISSLVHDDVLDSAPTRRGLESTHLKFGVRNACFGADYLIGRGVQKISMMEEPQLFQVYATIMDNLTSGEYIQARKNKDFGNMERLLRDYVTKSYYKTGSLISNSCRGVCIIEKQDQDVQTAAFEFGKHIGIAFQLIDDILDYTRTAQELGKEALSDLKEGVVTGPILFAIHEMSESSLKPRDHELMLRICNLEEKSDFDVHLAARILSQTSGIEKTKWLAYMHAEKCVKHLRQIIKNKNVSEENPAVKEAFDNLVALIFHVLQRQS